MDPEINPGALSLIPSGDTFMYIEPISNSSGDENFTVGFEKPNIFQPKTFGFSCHKFSGSSNDSVISISRLNYKF